MSLLHESDGVFYQIIVWCEKVSRAASAEEMSLSSFMSLLFDYVRLIQDDFKKYVHQNSRQGYHD